MEKASKTVDQVFHELRLKNRKALIPFFTAGYPDLETFKSLVQGASRSGADIIEVGIPFSDPIADGPTIQHSSAASLRDGITLASAIHTISALSATIPTPLVVMSYFNPILRMGITPFVRASHAAGVSGVIVPDLPEEETDLLRSATNGTNLTVISLLAPTSSEERIEMLAARAEGFIYLVSVTGVTGARNQMPEGLPRLVATVRRHISLPICLGFGISSPSQARSLLGYVDGFIVGSAIIERIRAEGERERAVWSVRRFLTSMRTALDKGEAV